jgi:hypothetical protein
MKHHLPIQIYIYPDNTSNKHHNNNTVNSIFEGETTSGKKIESITDVHLKIKDDCDPDYQILIEAFKLASNKPHYDHTYIIVCKSTAVSSSSSQTILDVLEHVINENENHQNEFDIFYLSKWLDRCDQYTNIKELDNGLKVINTNSPNGFHCIMFSPKGRKKFLRSYHPNKDPIVNRPLAQVLNSRISYHDDKHEGVFIALSTTPTLLSYDVIEGRGDPMNTLKASECRDTHIPTKPTTGKTTSNMGFFWFIIITVIIVIAAWLLIKVGYYYSKKSENIEKFDNVYPHPSQPKMRPVGEMTPEY